MIVKHLQHAAARLGHPLGRIAGAGDDAALGRGAIQIGGAGRHAQHQGQRGQRVVSGAGKEFQKVRRQRFGLDPAQHRAQFGRVKAALPLAPDCADDATRPKGAQHQLPGRDPTFGRQIVKDAHGFGGQHRDAVPGREESGVWEGRRHATL